MESLKLYLNEVRTIPLLTAQEEIDLSRKIKKGDEYARKAMIRANLRLVINIAKRYMYLGIPFMDLIEEGNLGLMKAVDKFNHHKGFRFSTYAAWWIKQSITRSISNQGKIIRVPVYMNDLITKWKKTKEQMGHKLKRVPSDREIAEKMSLTDSRKEQINFWLSASTSSLEAPVSEEGDSTIIDLVEDHTTAAPDSQIELIFNKERVEGLLGIMSDREKEILDMRFGLADGRTHTLAEIAKKLKLSRERVRQIEDAALKKLRKFIKQEKTRE